MDARFLTQLDRDAFKRVLYTRRDEIGRCIKRMEARQWYTDDAMLQNLRSAWHALHAAVQVMVSLDGTPVTIHPPRVKPTADLRDLRPPRSHTSLKVLPASGGRDGTSCGT